jgi:hypothetical protein
MVMYFCMYKFALWYIDNVHASIKAPYTGDVAMSKKKLKNNKK